MVHYCPIQDRPMPILFLLTEGRIFSIVSALRTFYSHFTHRVMNAVMCVGNKRMRSVLQLRVKAGIPVPVKHLHDPTRPVPADTGRVGSGRVYSRVRVIEISVTITITIT